MFWRQRKQADFEAEIESHIAIEADRLRQEGLSAADAESAARQKFGNRRRAEERFYEGQRVVWLEDLHKDIRYAVRMARHSPVFAGAVILTLALGIGATASIFSVTDAALIRPLPFPGADRLVSLYEVWEGDRGDLAPADFLYYQDQMKSFEGLAAYRHDSFNLGGQDRPERILGAVVTPNFFAVMKVPAEFGRTLDAALDKPGSARTVVLSDSLWKRRYAASTDIVGKVISVDAEPRVVVGVMPPSFSFPGSVEMWTAARFRVPEHPLRPMTDLSTSRGSHYFDIIGRLKPGVALSRAQVEAEVIGKRLKQQYPDDEEGDGRALIPLRDDLVGDARGAVLILLSAVAVLFLVACANVANIVLARGAARQKEVAIRGSLGAGRLRLVQQLLVESFLLSLAGAALGLLGAHYGLRSLEALIPVDVLPPGGLHVDLRLIAFAAFVSVLATVLFGIFPALQAAKRDLNAALKESGRASTGGVAANRNRKVLVATQMALAAVLLTGAGLLIRSFDRVLSAPEGFNPDHVLSLQLSLPIAQYPTPADRNRFAAAFLDRLHSLSGVDSAALTSRLPLNPGGSARGIAVKGRVTPAGGDLSPGYLVVSPEYFAALRIPMLEGRPFTDRDTAGAPGVVIVNAAMARHFWPGQDALGKFMKIDDAKDWSIVVGVVPDVVQQTLNHTPRPAFYVPYAQDPWPVLALVTRTTRDPSTIASAVIDALHQVDKNEPVYNVRTMREVISSSVQVRRFRTVLLALFAFLALALATVGIYGVMAYTIAERQHEIGIRLALGAQPAHLQLRVVTEGLILAAYGIAAGLAASLVLMRFLSDILYGVRSTDAPTFAAAVLCLIIPALVASYIPARRVVRINPANIFRAQ